MSQHHHAHTLPPCDPAAEAYAGELITEAARIRLPELFTREQPDALYRLVNRHGVSATVARTSSLTERQVVAIMTFRLAQYLSVRHVHPELVFARRMRYEPFSFVSPDDIHLLVGSAATGELLCYAALRGLRSCSLGATLRTRARELFPVEDYHGWGVFHELPVLPDLPLGRVRELARFMRNQRVHARDELGARGPIELGAALSRLLTDGSLHQEIGGLIGDFEEHFSMQNLLYFHTPLVYLRRTAVSVPASAYLSPRYAYHTIYPYAILTGDCGETQRERLALVEEALALPGRAALRALLQLKHSASVGASSLAVAEAAVVH